MKRGLLPLTALRSFEAAGRHENFTRAAQELFVSQAAVSRQVRELEAWLGHPLFERLHRQVVLTAQGRALLEQLTTSFDEIGCQLEEIKAKPAETILSISADPAFAACWLVPRLEGFRRLHPEIDVALDPDPRPAEFRAGRVQLGIRWSETETSWPRLQAVHLADAILSPVIAPALVAAGPPLRKPADLRRYTLLHEDGRSAWARWFQHAGAPAPNAARGPLFTEGMLVLQAAARGHGVALTNMLLAQEDLQRGSLIKPFAIGVPGGAYWLVAPDLQRLSPEAAAFVSWMREEFARRDA